MYTQFGRMLILALALLAPACTEVEETPSTDPTPFTARLDFADTLELFSLQPERPAEGQPGFNNYEIVGSTVLTDESVRKEIAKAIQQASSDPEGFAKGCEFVPHHGLRAIKDGKTTDFVICFQCGDVRVYEGGQRVYTFFITKGPQALLDATLHAAPLVDRTSQKPS